MVGSMRWCKVPVDSSMFTRYGVKHTDVANPAFEMKVFQLSDRKSVGQPW
jgi:hypothetical protein